MVVTSPVWQKTQKNMNTSNWLCLHWSNGYRWKVYHLLETDELTTLEIATESGFGKYNVINSNLGWERIKKSLSTSSSNKVWNCYPKKVRSLWLNAPLHWRDTLLMRLYQPREEKQQMYFRRHCCFSYKSSDAILYLERYHGINVILMYWQTQWKRNLENGHFRPKPWPNGYRENPSFFLHA